MSNDELYLEVTKEVEGENRDQALWAKVMTLFDGDESKAKYEYIRARVKYIIEERELTEDNKPTIDEFKKQIGSVFGKLLNNQAIEAAEDFWEHWESFYTCTSNKDFNVKVDYLLLSYNFPEYKRYNSYKGIGKILTLIGIIIIFFMWQVGIAIAIAGGLTEKYGDFIKKKDGLQFHATLMEEIRNNHEGNGYAKLCAYYIAGIVKLVTSNGSAVWPQYPSNAVTGEVTSISND